MNSKLSLLLLTITFFGYGQENPFNDNTVELFEAASENNSNSENFNDYLENLRQFSQNSININTATHKDLLLSNLFTTNQINEILEYRKKYLQFVDKEELYQLPSFSTKELEKILNYITIAQKSLESPHLIPTLQQASKTLLYRTQRTLEQEKGYKDDTFEGSPWKQYIKYRLYTYEKLSAGFTLEKDAGESLDNGFDYTSFHLQIKPKKFVYNILLGDYKIMLGQGLTVWHGLSFQKSVYVNELCKSSVNSSPHSSINEINFFRGGAITLKLHRFRLLTFYSSKNIDGNIVEDSLNTTFSSIQTTGFHRTESEIDDRKAVSERVFGTRLSYNGNGIQIGINGVVTNFDKPLNRSDQPYNKFKFAGTTLQNYSLDYKFYTGQTQLFGETAINSNKGVASINGLTFIPSKGVKYSIVYRNYNKGYESFYANAFGENSSPNNETGIYQGITMQLNKDWTLATYIDFYRHKWIKYNVDAPSQGKDFIAQLNYSPSELLDVYVRIKRETKQENFSENTTVSDYLVNNTKSRYRIHGTYQLTDASSIKCRIEASQGNTNNLTGFLTYQELSTYIKKLKIGLTTRITYFNTNTFDDAIYAYESDVLYSFTIPAFYGEGYKWIAILKFKRFRKIKTALKYSFTKYLDRETISSGNSEINNNIKNEIKFQVLYTF